VSSRTKQDSFEELLAEAVEVPAMLPSGAKLLGGRFVIQRLLGSGGMGTVYQAEDRAHYKVVAVKMLTRVSAAGIYRLKQEFRSLVDVVHPNLVGLHELCSDNGQWFFTMDLVPGVTLLERLGPTPNAAMVRLVFAELAKGISAIHQAGKLHRDLKPSNVLLNPEGRVVILDFGLVSDRESGGVGQTATDDGLVGTPLYMAPEQVEGEAATSATDWYAFGVMLYEALSGNPPFAGTVPSILRQKREQDAPNPALSKDDIPEDLKQLTMQLLAREPGKRPDGDQVMKVLGVSAPKRESYLPQDDVRFVGREQELSALHKAFAATDKGQPIAVFIEGLSGVGKTALMKQFLTRLHRQGRMVVLEGRCYERESVPYKACDSLIDALSRHLKQLPPEQAALVLPRHIHALAQIFPALQRLDMVQRVKMRQPLPLDPSELRRVAFSALKALLANLAEQERLVLAVDDLQWSDVDGAKLLSALVSPPDAPPLLLLGAYRSEEVEQSPGLGVLLERVSKLDNTEVRTLTLSELDEEKSIHLAKHLLPDGKQSLASRIAVESGGSPFFISELSRYASSGPAEVGAIEIGRAIERRVASLQENEREILEAVSISARPVGQPLLQAVIGTDDIATPLRHVHAQKLISFAGGASSMVRGYHDKIREAVVAGMTRERRRDWHARLADTLEKTDTMDPMLLFQHYRGAGDLQKAARYADLAGDLAADALAFEKAARLYQAALELHPGDEENKRQLQIKLGNAQADAGLPLDASESYLAASRSFTGEQSMELRYKAALQALVGGNFKTSRELLGEVLPYYGLSLPANRPVAVAKMLATQTQVLLRKPRLPKNDRAVSQAVRRQIDICTEIGQQLYFDDMVFGLYFMSLGILLRMRSKNAAMMPLAQAFHAMFQADRHPEKAANTLVTIEEIVLRARMADDPQALALTLFNAGVASYLMGKSQTGVLYCQESEQVYREQCIGANAVFGRRQAICNFLTCLIHVGDYKKLRSFLYTGRNQELLQYSSFGDKMFNLSHAFERLAADDPQRADQIAGHQLSGLNLGSFTVPDAAFVIFKCFIDCYLKQPEEALKRLKKYHSKIRKIGILRVRIRAFDSFYWVRAVAALAASMRGQQRDNWARLAHADAKRMRKLKLIPALAAANGISAGLALHQGRLEEAVRLLELSADQFENHEMPNWGACARRSLGLVKGGDEGQAMVTEADHTLSELGIKNPARWATIWFPGFDLK
jgi:hypothetical protein